MHANNVNDPVPTKIQLPGTYFLASAVTDSTERLGDQTLGCTFLAGYVSHHDIGNY